MPRWLNTVGKVLWGIVGGLVVAAIIVMLLYTQTGWGRRHVLSFGLKQLTDRVHGYVQISRLHGNLLTGARLDDVVITDSARRPFLAADTLELRYSLRSLIARHLVFSDVRLVHGTVILDKPPSEDWNFARIFPTGPPTPHRGPGFGSWILIQGMTVQHSTFMVRNVWAPNDSLRGAARDSAIADALSPRNRQWIVPVAGGWQSLSVFGEVNARLPVMRLADPDSANRLIEIAGLSMVAFPFRPPGALVRDMRVRVVITKDSLLFDSFGIVLPGSRAGGVGGYALNGSGARVQLALRPFTFQDASFLHADMPGGGGRMGLAFTSHKGRTHVIASDMDLHADGAALTGLADFQVGPDFFRVGPSNVAFANVDTRLVRHYAPSAPLKVAGTLDGSVRLAGTAAAMEVSGWTDFRERGGPTSRIVADGGVGSGATGLQARRLHLRFEPLYLSLVRGYDARVPYRGRLTGDLTLTGSTGAGFSLAANLVDSDPAAGRSHLLANGGVSPRNGLTARDLRLIFRPLQVSLLRPLIPRLPYGGTITGRTTLNGSTRTRMDVAADLVHQSAATGRSHVLANGGIQLAGGAAARELTLRMEPLQVAVLRPFAPKLSYGGTLTGVTTLTGSPARGVDIVADVTHVDPKFGRSHVGAAGRIAFRPGVSTEGLRLRLDPLQVAELRPFAPNLPVEGALSGRANVTASVAAKRFAAILDLEHTGPTGYSHVVGNADATWSRPGSFDVNLRVPALSLATVGAFAPSAGLRGSGTGTVVARGRLAELTTHTSLAIAGGGAFDLRGNLDLASARKRYDFTAGFTAFNAAAVTTHAPQTSLSGNVVARGVGTDPATMSAFLDASLLDSGAAGTPRLDTALVTARVDNGVASFQRGHVRLGSALADISGSFGLTEARSGTLRYVLRVDTISQFASHLPVDTGTVAPRPVLQARRMATARADSARIAGATEVQRAAVGYPPGPMLHPDTLPLRRDTLAGSFSSTGTLTGNVKRFDAQGTAQARTLSFGASYVGAGTAKYSLVGYGTKNPLIHLDAFAETVSVAGFAFDSARALVSYNGLTRNGSGIADIALFQDPQRDYRVRSDFDLALDRRRVALQTLLLRFDTTTWRSTRPSTIGWGKPGVTVGGLELVNGTGGYLRADGRLATAGSADLRLDIEGLQVGDVTALIQDTMSLKGVLGLHARLQGNSRSPVIAGTAGLVRASWGGNPFPDVRATLDYANADLRANARFFQGPLVLAVADARLPVNLALTGVSGPRLMRNRPFSLDLRADSLPLEALPSFTTAVSDVRGRVRGTIATRGTIDDATTNGTLLLDLGSLRVTSTGVLYTDVGGTVRLRDKTAYVDSVVAHSVGTVRATGTMDLTSLARPSLDLAIVSRDATLLDDKRGRIRADANLAVKGPYTGLGVTGNATITGGVIYAPELQNQRATNLQDPTLVGAVDTTGFGAVLPAPKPLLQNLKVDVGLRIEPDTWVRNSKANVEIYTPEDVGPLRVTMDNAHQVLSLLGSVNSDRGEYTYAGRVFQLSTGSATFMGGQAINPLLQLTAIYNVQRQGQEALAIQVNVSGTMKAPRVNLQSNAQPPLPQSDLLSYLAFGQPASSLLSLQGAAGLTTGGGQGAFGGIPGLLQQQIASLAIGATVEQSVSDLQEQGTRAGLDVFRVHPGELPAEAAFQSYFRNFLNGTEFEAGKYLNRRLFIEMRGRASTLPGVLIQYREHSGFTWTATWEPRYRPAEPSFSALTASRVRALGTLLLWSKRF